MNDSSDFLYKFIEKNPQAVGILLKFMGTKLFKDNFHIFKKYYEDLNKLPNQLTASALAMTEHMPLELVRKS